MNADAGATGTSIAALASLYGAFIPAPARGYLTISLLSTSSSKDEDVSACPSLWYTTGKGRNLLILHAITIFSLGWKERCDFFVSVRGIHFLGYEAQCQVRQKKKQKWLLCKLHFSFKVCPQDCGVDGVSGWQGSEYMLGSKTFTQAKKLGLGFLGVSVVWNCSFFLLVMLNMKFVICKEFQLFSIIL